MTQNFIRHLFDKFSIIYGRLWAEPKEGTPQHHAVVNEWLSILRNVNVTQVRYAVEYIQSGQSDYSQYPPNCIQFGLLCKSFRSNHFQRQLTKHFQPDWRDVAMHARVRRLESEPHWPTVVEKAKKSGRPLEYLMKWAKRRSKEGL